MKVNKVIDLHYGSFIMYVDKIDDEEIEKIKAFVPKSKFLFLVGD